METKPVITLKYGTHRGFDVVFIQFNYSDTIIKNIKQFDGIKWSLTNKCWYLPANSFNLNNFFKSISPYAFIDYTELKGSKKNNIKTAKEIEDKNPTEEKKEILVPKAYIDLLDQKRYSRNTKKIYIAYFNDFVNAFKNKDLTLILKQEINAYILNLIKDREISTSQQNQRINSIKFYYEKVLGHEKQEYDILRPRKEFILPDVLSKEEIGQMIKITENLKHKSLIALIYSCGLRRSEAINIKLGDIDSKRMLIKIRGGKGKKDRYVQLAHSMLKLLREYYLKYRPKDYIFEGQNSEQYSATSIVEVIKEAAKKAGIKKRVYPHILRHSYATHNLEQGVDLRYIQEWLGHASSKTTERYTHVSEKNFKNFKNPIDDFEL